MESVAPKQASCARRAAPSAGSTRGKATSAEGSLNFIPSRMMSRKGESLDSSPPAHKCQAFNGSCCIPLQDIF